MKLLREDGTFKVYRMKDKKLAIYDGWHELNHYSPAGEPLGNGRYMSAFQKDEADELAMRCCKATSIQEI